ncbi:hypothetical protein [Paenibacillus flagellatus]|uniref:Uncharacterized protein n=1 Tax=Paenibacillus flagellatus TaxID=2211139 RepID=A0A2V5JYG5_9BACL|nr:hypothetical protein [Paenibacillus flagellatus]PYI51741.1 hypothetical protein DLM86_22720 [Paenibacillus flagellatus]
MLEWINRINLLWTFVFLLAGHALLYYSLGNADWFTLALLAALVDTGVVAVIQTLGRITRKQSND